MRKKQVTACREAFYQTAMASLVLMWVFVQAYGYIDVFHLTLGVAIYSYHTPNVHNLTP